MRELLSIILLLGISFSLQPSEEVNHLDDKAEIRALWNEMSEAVCSGDWESYSNLWAHEPDIELIHPGQREWLVGWESIGPKYKKLLESDFRCELDTQTMRIHVSSSGEMAWLTAEVMIRVEGNSEATRMWETGVFEKNRRALARGSRACFFTCLGGMTISRNHLTCSEFGGGKEA